MSSLSHTTEWQLLQNQYDSFEKYSLIIKLVNVFVLIILLINPLPFTINLLVLLTLWLQDGIWKTFQSRIETRLIALETVIELIENGAQANNAPLLAFQFNKTFMSTRRNGISLILEYVKQALRPTVAFPHCILVVILMINTYCL